MESREDAGVPEALLAGAGAPPCPSAPGGAGAPHTHRQLAAPHRRPAEPYFGNGRASPGAEQKDRGGHSSWSGVGPVLDGGLSRRTVGSFGVRSASAPREGLFSLLCARARAAQGGQVPQQLWPNWEWLQPGWLNWEWL